MPKFIHLWSVWVHLGPNHSQSLRDRNFTALWPTDPKFSMIKNLIPFIAVSKVQEASSILEGGGAVKVTSFTQARTHAHTHTIINQIYMVKICVSVCSETSKLAIFWGLWNNTKLGIRDFGCLWHILQKVQKDKTLLKKSPLVKI